MTADQYILTLNRMFKLCDAWNCSGITRRNRGRESHAAEIVLQPIVQLKWNIYRLTDCTVSAEIRCPRQGGKEEGRREENNDFYSAIYRFFFHRAWCTVVK
ncbi:hypothetical protein CEXT_708291 [Caerostris extrusa]|uniref:Uncharacterized protein n=1 Tax=Caerostris extrusa TaxID=172846 RepID=A0AAV4Q3B1_CAEEX|nr:hypothetical protein CEXT_708291 [Caerostris extrusa]